ncbi:LuxR C-terminal-related transcriptional regulator [Herbiconiux sp. SYSU D00978]|uniref:LuxR C-terminal-related transcriptional regulator n=1 Tax=Herbiconiux sp. SYSU D00978 TaxID=2812562 RepID=UPI0027DAEE9C|nr:LuxR C-terminal-related transcriptional regulator [Herbiconiux sp. SYSU D00978]
MRTRHGAAAPGVVHAAAASLLAEITPDDRLAAAISGAHGAGKSTLLDGIERRYRAMGVDVHRRRDGVVTVETAGRRTLLVDDAHELDAPVLRRVRDLVDAAEVNLFVAYRPWPVSRDLHSLARALEQHHERVVLGPLGREELLSRAAADLSLKLPSHVADDVLRMTGGNPRLVGRMLAALAGASHGRGELIAPQQLVEELGHELRGVGDELRELLLGLAIGADLSEWMPSSLRGAGVDIDELVAQADSAGFLLPDGRVVPLVQQALLEATPPHHVRTLQRDLVDTLVARGRPLDTVARNLARHGLADPRVAVALERAADHVLTSEPAVAHELYAAGAAAGLDQLSIAARRAQAELVTGDLDGAARLVDDLLDHEEVPDVRRAVDVTAAVWADRGMLGRAADAYRWLGPARVGASAPLAALAMFGSGDREGAERLLDAPALHNAPTLGRVALTLMAQGVRESLTGSGAPALRTLIRASDTMTAAGGALPLPDTPASLAALVALHLGDLAVAESVLDSALTAKQGGAIAQARLLLLKAWVDMRADRLDQARDDIARAVEATLTPRDEVMLRALEVGLARRTDDVPALVRSWRRAREGLLHVDVDLYDLLPLSEFVVAAARLRESSRIEAPLAEAWSLLERLGDPPLWSVPLRWAAVQAGILAETPAALAPHAAALVRASKESRAAAVFATAGRTWVAVLSGDLDVAAVESSAKALASLGFTWDGSRLAGHAAAHAEDRRDMARLLACARDLHHPPQAPAPAPADPQPTPASAPRAPGEAVLSAREREVARLVLEGKNYRQIGEAIFISPRTVEHHVARIRQRLDVSTRAELLTQLRIALENDADA